MLTLLNIYRLAEYLRTHHLSLLGNPLRKLLCILNACRLAPGIILGKDVYLAHSALGIVIAGGTVIGDRTVILPNVTIGISGRRFKKDEKAPRIGSDVYIGTGTRIMGEITIGNGAVIAANAVVTKSVPPKTLVGGVPAKVLRKNINREDYLYIRKPKV